MNLFAYFLVLVESVPETGETEKATHWLKYQLEQLRQAMDIDPKDLHALQDYYAQVLRAYVVDDGVILHSVPHGEWVTSHTYPDGTIERLDARGDVVWATVMPVDGSVEPFEVVRSAGDLHNFEVWHLGKRIDNPNIRVPGQERETGLRWEDLPAEYELPHRLLVSALSIVPGSQAQGTGLALVNWLAQRAKLSARYRAAREKEARS